MLIAAIAETDLYDVPGRIIVGLGLVALLAFMLFRHLGGDSDGSSKPTWGGQEVD